MLVMFFFWFFIAGYGLFCLSLISFYFIWKGSCIILFIFPKNKNESFNWVNFKSECLKVAKYKIKKAQTIFMKAMTYSMKPLQKDRLLLRQFGPF